MNRFLKLSVVLPTLAILALGCAWIGWDLQLRRLDDALFKAIHVVGAGGDYALASSLKGNPWLHAARWLGLAFFVLTATKALRLILAKQIKETVAQFVRRDVVLIGDAPKLASLAKTLAVHRKVLWLAPAATGAIAKVRVVEQANLPKQIKSLRIARATLVIVMFTADDVQAMEVAGMVNAARPGIDVIILSRSLPDIECDDVFGPLHHVRVIPPSEPVVRSLHRRQPPFAETESVLTRLHCLVIGCGDMGEAVMRDWLMSSLVAIRPLPIVTIVDPRADEIEASFSLRYPELHRSADVNFLSVRGGTDARALPLEALLRAAATPFSAAYVCIRSDDASLAAAVELERLAMAHRWPLKAIFVRQSHSAAEARTTMNQAYRRITPFGTADQLADGLALIESDPDERARTIHDAYRTTAPTDAPANVDWAVLPERWRQANRRAATHIPAKRESARLHRPDESDDDRLERLARLEHERWMVERRLAGWQHGPVRDDRLRHHPDLVAFDQLSAASKAVDLQIVTGVLKALAAG